MSSAAVPNFSCVCDDGTTGSGVSWWRIVASALIAVNAMTFAIAVNTSDDPKGDRLVLQIGTLAATLIITVLLGRPLAVSAWAALRRKQITVEALFVLSFGGA